MLVFVLQWLSLHREILIMLLSQFPSTFHQIPNGMLRFIAKLMTILVLIGTIFMILWEMFHGRISLNSVLLLLIVNFVSGSGWNWCIWKFVHRHFIASKLNMGHGGCLDKIYKILVEILDLKVGFPLPNFVIRSDFFHSKTIQSRIGSYFFYFEKSR